MENIAVFLDEKEETTSFLDSKFIYLYENKNNEWRIKKELIVDFDNLNNTNEIRTMFYRIIEELGNCKIVVVKKGVGIGYSVFYSEDFSIWEFEGNIEKILDLILKKELEHEEYKNKEIVNKKRLKISEISDKIYYLDLIKLQMERPEISSKMALKPFLDKNKFKELKVHCCHVPPWLEMHSKQNSLIYKVEKCFDGNLNIVLTR